MGFERSHKLVSREGQVKIRIIGGPMLVKVAREVVFRIAELGGSW
ncbi:MAG: hypothetical protein ACJ8DI_29170 [Ktedonobacteraceae bacterium]